MSEENVEIVRRAIDAWNRRDIDDLIALSDPEGEYVNNPTAIEPGTRRGRDEVTAVIRTQWDLLTDGRWEIDLLYNCGEEIIALGRLSRRMPGSDARLEDRSLVSYRIRSGKILRTEVLGFGREEVQTALEGAGLQELAMSEENVETISRSIDAWNRGDLEGFLAGAHPDIEWHPVLPAGVEGSGGVYRGHDEARQFWAEFWAMFDEFRITIQSARAVGTSVLVLAQIQGRAHSGVPVDTPWGAVFEMRDGLCIKTEAFLDHKSALEAAGLRE